MSSSMALRRSPKARSLDSSDVEDAAELVDDESREGFTFDVFGDDEERTAGLGNLFKERKHVLEGGDLLLVDEDVSVLKEALPWTRGW
jgi:hypothetical protein